MVLNPGLCRGSAQLRCQSAEAVLKRGGRGLLHQAVTAGWPPPARIHTVQVPGWFPLLYFASSCHSWMTRQHEYRYLLIRIQFNKVFFNGSGSGQLFKENKLCFAWKSSGSGSRTSDPDLTKLLPVPVLPVGNFFIPDFRVILGTACLFILGRLTPSGAWQPSWPSSCSRASCPPASTTTSCTFSPLSASPDRYLDLKFRREKSYWTDNVRCKSYLIPQF